MPLNSPFRIVEHVVPGQYIREYPQATAVNQEDTLYLAVKQYIPLDNPNPKPGDVTIIASHANGFPKELYEPLWEEFCVRAKQQGFRVRSIWMADVAHQGQSGIVNEHVVGNDPSWFDHPRDLLNLINLKRKEMPRPLVGIGHSFGGCQLVTLSLMHPRLFHSLVLLDPTIQRQSTQGPIPKALTGDGQGGTTYTPINTLLSTYRRDIWPSRQAAAESFKRSPFYQKWNPRVFDRWVKYGLRELPTAIYPLDEQTKGQAAQSNNHKHGDNARPVTLATTRHQEVFTFSRPNYDYDPVKNRPASTLTHPDLNPAGHNAYPFYRPEPIQIFERLPNLRPSVYYIFGGESELSVPALRDDKIKNTGTGTGGSGGVAANRVRWTILEGIGHLVAQEAVEECAAAAAEFLGTELRRWQVEEEAFQAQWNKKSKVQKATVDEKWLKVLGPPLARRPKGDGNGGPASDSKL